MMLAFGAIAALIHGPNDVQSLIGETMRQQLQIVFRGMFEFVPIAGIWMLTEVFIAIGETRTKRRERKKVRKAAHRERLARQVTLNAKHFRDAVEQYSP